MMILSGRLRPAPFQLGLCCLLLAIVLLSPGCSAGSDEQEDAGPPAESASTTTAASAESGVVLYTIGLSTDPYGNSRPGGFGVVLNLGDANQRKLEARNPELGSFGGPDWIGDRQMLVPRDAPPFRPPLLYRLRSGRLVREGPSPLPPLDTQQEWSPDGKLIASQPIEPCEPNQKPRWKCSRQADEIYLQEADGSGRRRIATGHFESWTPDGRLLVTGGRSQRALACARHPDGQAVGADPDPPRHSPRRDGDRLRRTAAVVS